MTKFYGEYKNDAYGRNEVHTCINHTASLSPSDMALYTAAPSDEI